MPKEIRAFIQKQGCNFLQGHIAPDVQVISKQPRPETHFFPVPTINPTSPWELIFNQFPHLSEGASLPPPQTIFIAGYICHLQADWIWIFKVFHPYFGPEVKKGGFHHRLRLHNVLRAYLDEQILDDLPKETGKCLGNTEPANWLPFISDEHLSAWRDLVARQLQPGAKSQTVDMFASRGGISSDEFSKILHSDERLEKDVLSIIPPELLVEYRQEVILENIHLLDTYLHFIST